MKLNMFANESDVKRLQDYVDDPEDPEAQHIVRLGIVVVDEVDGEEQNIGWTELSLTGAKPGLQLFFHAASSDHEDHEIVFEEA